MPGSSIDSRRTGQASGFLDLKRARVPAQLPPDLVGALRHGPFEAALDAAIRASGLSLDRIQRRLAERGVEVSVTTLSYWRRGRSRPERPQSRQAVRLMEELLGVPTDGLVSLLGPRRPRGRWVNKGAEEMDTERLWQGYADVQELFAELGSTDDGLLRVAAYDRYEMGALGQESRQNCRLVLKATREHVDRCVIIVCGEDPDLGLPVLVDVRNARPGRLRSDPSVPVLAAELFLDRILAEGETALVEYTVAFPESGRATSEAGRGFRAPAQLYTLEVGFPPDSVPVRCTRCVSAPGGGEPVSAEPAWISAAGRAHAVFQNPDPGFLALRWEWS